MIDCFLGANYGARSSYTGYWGCSNLTDTYFFIYLEMCKLILLLLTALTIANALVTPIISVTVGAGGLLQFDPPFVGNVGAGQRIHFDLRALNHTVTESSFEHPCTKLANAQFDTVFNNFNPNDIPNLHPFDITLDSDQPRFFYCRQGAGTSKSHCQKGMVFAINIDEEMFSQFAANAAVDNIVQRSPI